jgi:hypothetical protein
VAEHRMQGSPYCIRRLRKNPALRSKSKRKLSIAPSLVEQCFVTEAGPGHSPPAWRGL